MAVHLDRCHCGAARFEVEGTIEPFDGSRWEAKVAGLRPGHRP